MKINTFVRNPYMINVSTNLTPQNIKWRKENKMDTILTEDFAVQMEHLPIFIDGEDKMGRPSKTRLFKI